MQETKLQQQTRAVLMLVPLMFLCFGIGLLLMYFIKPPVYYCPLPQTMEEMQSPPTLINENLEEHSEIDPEVYCEGRLSATSSEGTDGATICHKG